MTEVLYRDELVLALAKPSGLPVHRGWARDGESLVDVARRLTGLATVHPVHRLDRATSGVVLLALDAGAARALAAQFERHEVDKRYLALVRGLAPESAEVDSPVPRGEDSRGPRVPAVTAVRRLAWVEALPRRLSLVEAAPRTGRLHQVRRHLKHLGHPVIGDSNYGNGPLNREVRARYGLARLALHAARLTVAHPATGAPLELAAPVPDDLRAPLERMGFEP